jgi:hypothetical protein
MSEASRAAALAHAATVHYGSGDAEGTLATAELFHAFVTDDRIQAVPAKPAKAAPAKVAAKATPAKVAAKPVAPVEDDAADEESAAEEGEVSKDDVGNAIEALLNANLRDKVIKLYAKFKAKSLSSLKPEDYAAVKQEAEDLLLNS